MLITRGTLKTLGVGFQTKFQSALKQSPSMMEEIAMTVPSSTKQEEYGWLGEIPNIREWLGDRQVAALSNFAYTIKNKHFEGTLEIDRDDIEDDNLNLYGPKLELLGRAAVAHKNQLCFDQLKGGFATNCFDGQYFFDTDHPILDANGAATTFANTDGGSGTPWYLIAKNMALMPVIFQLRKDYTFINRDQPNDDNVFWQNKFVYGTDARYNVGYGLPQLAWGSKQTLDDTHFNTAVAALMGMKSDYGRPIGATEFKLIVPPSLRSAGLNIVNAATLASGASNVNYKTADLVIVPWLA